ncbi:hypothetical protein [Hymenobacter sp. B81]|uniref:hypothetical protein n=1 Tax=Hymenobacter sp. B81 TaxID=3344878 RepID=UPI0037DD3B9D
MTKAGLLVTALLFHCQTALACMCLSPPPIDRAFSHSSLIFKGRVTEIARNKFYNSQGFGAELINFEVTQGYKKAKSGGGVISIVNTNTSCDFFFEEGKEYFVFAHDLGGGYYSTSSCTKTAEAGRFLAADLKILQELSRDYGDISTDPRNALVVNKPAYLELVSQHQAFSATIAKQQRQLKLLLGLLIGVTILAGIYITRLKSRKPGS